MQNETRIAYYIGNEETPYISKINLPQDIITLGNFKEAINKSNYKFFFRTKDPEFGVVKEEINDDGTKLPVCDNKIVAWLMPLDNDAVSMCSTTSGHKHENSNDGIGNVESLSVTSAQRQDPQMNRMGFGRPLGNVVDDFGSQSTLMSTDWESSTIDSHDDRYSTFSESTIASARRHRQQRRRRKRVKPRIESDTTSTYSSSITDSSMSLNILSVTLNMEKYNFLGISIVGQSNDKGDGGIYIGSIMKGGAVAADNRIEPGDMLLQVNDTNFEKMTNDDAVRVLRDIVHKPGPITLTVAKCWDPTPQLFNIPKHEPVQPIDPATWLTDMSAARWADGSYPSGMAPALSTNLTETSSDTMASSLPESERYDQPLSVRTEMAAVVKMMRLRDSGLEIKTRMWLKITIPDAFIGSELVDWLNQKVQGLQDRKNARKYASSLLKAGYIRHTVNKITFSEQCYYVFGDYNGTHISKDMGNLSLGDSNSEQESDVLGPLPNPTWQGGNVYNAYNSSYGYQQQLPGSNPPGTIQPGYQSGMMPNGPPPAYHNGMQSDDTMSIRSGTSYSPSVIGGPPPLPQGHSSGGSESDRASRHSGKSGKSGSKQGSSKSGSTGGLEKLTDRIGSQLSLTSQGKRSNRDKGKKIIAPYHSQLPPQPINSNNTMQYHQASTLPYRHPNISGPPPISNLPDRSGANTPVNTLPQRSLSAVPQDMSGSRQSFQQAMGNPCEYFVDVM